MKVKWISIGLAVMIFIGCSSHRQAIKSEFDFANKLAQQGLWKEAYFRWEKARTQGMETAAVYNNIAVALENMGRLDDAEKMYKKALTLAHGDSTIQGNLTRLNKLSKKNEDEKK